MKQIWALSSLFRVDLLAAALQGGALSAGGAAAGYAASQERYEVRSPVVDTTESRGEQEE